MRAARKKGRRPTGTRLRQSPWPQMIAEGSSNPDVLHGHRGSGVELRGDDVLGARAFGALADGECHVLAFAQGVEWRARARGLVKEVFGAVGRRDKAEPFVRDALDGAVGS